MTTEKEVKDLAFQLYLQGTPTDGIAQQCKVSRRTIQRWVKEFEQTSVNLAIRSSVTNVKPDSHIESETLSGQELVATLSKKNQTLNLKITSRLAIRLLSLTETAINTVENCLTDPDVKSSDRLKAVQIVGDWLGLSSPDSVLKKLTRNFELDTEIIDTNTAETVFTPHKLLLAKEEENRLFAEKRRNYTDEIFDNFIETGELTTLIKEKFDSVYFLNNIEDWDECKGTQFLRKAVVTLKHLDYPI